MSLPFGPASGQQAAQPLGYSSVPPPSALPQSNPQRSGNVKGKKPKDKKKRKKGQLNQSGAPIINIHNHSQPLAQHNSERQQHTSDPQGPPHHVQSMTSDQFNRQDDYEHAHDKHGPVSKLKGVRRMIHPAKPAILQAGFLFLLPGIAFLASGLMSESDKLPLAKNTQAGLTTPDAVLLRGFCSSALGSCYSFDELAKRQQSLPVLAAYLAGLNRVYMLHIGIGALALAAGAIFILMGCHDDGEAHGHISIIVPVRVGLGYCSFAGIFFLSILESIVAFRAYSTYGLKDASAAWRIAISAASVVMTSLASWLIMPVKEGSRHAEIKRVINGDYDYNE